MTEGLSGSTVVLGLIGDPVAQVKAPAPLTERFRQRGLNAVLVPLHVKGHDVPGLLEQLLAVSNFAGIIATVPHKQLAASLCPVLTPRAREANAVNLLRKTGGQWEGDLQDGTGFVAGLVRNGVDPKDRHVLLAGAGGAGNAIAFALSQAGVASLAVRDVDVARQDALVARLQSLGYPARAWTTDAHEAERQASLLVNATPIGMRADDPLPVPERLIQAGLAVADVIMEPHITPLLALAQRKGCKVVHGKNMMNEQLEGMVAFFEPAIHAAKPGA